MIDFDTVSQTAEGSRFDKAVALLIGLVALLAAALAVAQVDRSGQETRAQLMSSRTVSQLITRLTGTTAVATWRLSSAQRAALGGLEATSRELVSLEDGDRVTQAVGAAQLAAYDRLFTIADTMGALPQADGPLDPYALMATTATGDELKALSDQQTSLIDVVASAASRSGASVVLGLSLVALAGVLGGLSAILREGRAGRITLVAGYVALTLACVAGVAAIL